MPSKPSVIILCGGLGLRMRSAPDALPKALTRVGGMPVLWHVMKIYSSWGYRRFILALGHRGDDIVAWFEQWLAGGRDLTLDFSDPAFRTYSAEAAAPAHLSDDERAWKITFAHTGELTMTGGRLRRAAHYIDGPRAFVTYADGVTDVSIPDVLAKHERSGHSITMLGVQIPHPFGVIEHSDGLVTRFSEKPQRACCINGGFFVVEKSVLQSIDGDHTIFEEDVLPVIAGQGRLGVYEHEGFWRCLDTPKDAHELGEMWTSHEAPWKRWD